MSAISSTTAQSYARLIDAVRVRCPGALDGAIKFELFFVLQEFTQRSDCWRDTLTFTAQSPTTDYVLTTASGGIINRLMWVVNPNVPGVPVPATMSVPGTVSLMYPPMTSTTLSAIVALTVLDPTDNTGWPYFDAGLLARYMPGLVDGVLSRLMSQVAKPYSSEKGALFHGKRFTNAIYNARREVHRENTYGGQVWRFPQTFRSQGWGR